MTRRTQVVGVAWSIAVVAIVIGLLAGAVRVASDFTSVNAFRWVMAAFFLGGPMAWFGISFRDELRSFFGRR